MGVPPWAKFWVNEGVGYLLLEWELAFGGVLFADESAVRDAGAPGRPCGIAGEGTLRGVLPGFDVEEACGVETA